MIPEELRKLPQWVAAGADKVPIDPRTGKLASVTDPSTWATFEEATAAGYPHVGFVLTADDDFTIIDLDKPHTPEQAERHKKILDLIPSYAELSASGEGVHIIVRGRIPHGVRRDRVEIYSEARYMICTGQAIRTVEVMDAQEMLDVLFAEMNQGNGRGGFDLVEYESSLDDKDIVETATRAANGEKFTKLCRGEWEGDYPSQSEADFALMNILAFYTRSNEQAMRLFRYSELGKRDKAQRNDYLMRMLKRIRAEETPPIDFSNFKPNGNGAHASEPALNGGAVPAPPATGAGGAGGRGVLGGGSSVLSFPPGFVGEVAQYIYESSSRPVAEVGIVAALGMCAGVVGRQYNISGTGLNQYLILLAKTGVGKEGGASGIERIVKAVRTTVPMVDSFMGPGTFASGQAVIRALDEKPCFFSLLGEFGLTLQTLSSSEVAGHNLVLRRVLLDLYSKSGNSSVLHSTAYSDKEKNTKTLHSPALTLLGESTPETFYEGLSESLIADGLIPRFLIVEYEGDRPRRNPDAFGSPPQPLVDRFADLVSTVLQMQANQSWAEVELDAEAEALLDKFDLVCDKHIIEGENEGVRQLWNRAHLKALRLAGVLAVVDRPHAPIVNAAEARWAVELVTRDCERLTARFSKGEIGKGDSKQRADVRRVLERYLEKPAKDCGEFHAVRVVPYRYILQRTANLPAFRNHRQGATAALRESLRAMEESGEIVEVPKAQAQEKFGTRQKLYYIELKQTGDN